MEKLTDFLEQRKHYPFHMPGHKSKPQFLYGGLNSADITEIYGADVLCSPKGVLFNLQKRMAKLFGANESFLLTNGSTCGVISALLSVCNRGDTVVAAKNAHKSFFSGIELSGANVVYVMPDITKYGFAGAVSPQAVEQALKKNKQAKAVFITSPTYEGVVSDINAISRIARDHNAVLIVDEAHGAHFAFSGYFPKTALEMGADIVIQSLHKTLPALTQTAVLHVRHGFNGIKVKRNIDMLQTSSPSYMMMAQAEFMTLMLEERGDELFEGYVENLIKFRKQASLLKKICLLNKSELDVFDLDLGKLVFYNKSMGFQIEKWLREETQIQVEAAFVDYIIAMTSIADTSVEFSRLAEGLCNIGNNNKNAQRYKNDVDLRRYIGKKAATLIIPFPPGVPLATPNETLSDEIINKLSILIRGGVVVSGVNEKNGKYYIDIKD